MSRAIVFGIINFAFAIMQTYRLDKAAKEKDITMTIRHATYLIIFILLGILATIIAYLESTNG